MGRLGGALGMGVLALGGIVACTALVDTSGLAGPADAAAPDTSSANVSGCASSCAKGQRCISSACVPSEALLAWWSFEETSPRVADVSGAGNHGTSHQAKQAPGKVGTGIELGAETCVLVPDSPSLRLADARALTMMAWTKVDGCAGSAADHGMILNKEHTYEIGVQCSGFKLQEAINSGDWSWHGGATLTRATWRHVAVTWDGTTVRHFVDGQEKDSHPQSGTIPAQDTGLGIGCRDVGSDGNPATAREWIAGTIDEAALYGRALTEAELRAYVEATR